MTGDAGGRSRVSFGHRNPRHTITSFIDDPTAGRSKGSAPGAPAAVWRAAAKGRVSRGALGCVRSRTVEDRNLCRFLKGALGITIAESEQHRHFLSHSRTGGEVQSRIEPMAAATVEKPLDVGGPMSRRAAALANVKWFRALAWRVLREGGPQAALRAANARAAARIILRQARRDALVSRMAREALRGDRVSP
ncbi:hypothetical protein [Methylobacterium brachiatum]|jgi:hypothetical protein|uniref:Uncharacterized protein n=3 Tax=Methylobacterium TaxID=407 RepID=A0ABV1QZF2_9HYPH